jgi:hypothetical protein
MKRTFPPISPSPFHGEGDTGDEVKEAEFFYAKAKHEQVNMLHMDFLIIFSLRSSGI